MLKEDILSFEEEEVEGTKLSVIVCTTPERRQHLHSVLANILKQNYKPYEVLIVTDAGYSDYVRNNIPLSVYGLLNFS